ncbi:MAG: hypothetical protein HKP58_07445 [Desulfatitalea sp.]|nr:PilN domain-containing protein [Desulfatitalea sp.]NNK00233.1 hypothetical protein [Desulfatitalea sp.]
MIRINLLPYRATRKKENIRYQVNVFIGSLLLVGLGIFWYYSHLSGQIEDLNTEIKSTQEQVAKYKKINQEIAEIKKKLDVLARKIDVIESLELSRKLPVQHLDALYTLLIEKRMWYTKIEEKGANIEVYGVAIDNQTVADYMTRVEQSDRFSGVRLASGGIRKYVLKGSEGMSLKEFGVTFQPQPEQTKSSEADQK